MATLQVKNLDHPDEVRPIGRGHVDLVDLEEVTIGRAVCLPGWRWSEDVGPIAAVESCPAHHRGYVIEGRFAVRLDDGVSAEFGPGDAFDVPPGHDSWTIGPRPCITLEYAGIRGFALPPFDPGDRRLLALLFVDIVDSTGVAARVGDASWATLLDEFRAFSEGALERYGGRKVDEAGDGMFAAFDGPARAIATAEVIRDQANSRALQVRCGIHTGEVEVVGARLRGAAVHVTARIMALAGADEILVSATTVDLVSGSGFTFEPRGVHRLRGVGEDRELYAVSGDGAGVDQSTG
jgi:class 3 adenylate cyclase